MPIDFQKHLLLCLHNISDICLINTFKHVQKKLPLLGKISKPQLKRKCKCKIYTIKFEIKKGNNKVQLTICITAN